MSSAANRITRTARSPRVLIDFNNFMCWTSIGLCRRAMNKSSPNKTHLETRIWKNISLFRRHSKLNDARLSAFREFDFRLSFDWFEVFQERNQSSFIVHVIVCNLVNAVLRNIVNTTFRCTLNVQKYLFWTHWFSVESFVVYSLVDCLYAAIESYDANDRRWVAKASSTELLLTWIR